MAARGEGLYQDAGADPDLRALASLYPEPVHIVVGADSPISDVAGLRGKRVDIGTAASGTQFDALAVLAAHGAAVTGDDHGRTFSSYWRRTSSAIDSSRRAVA